MKNRSALNHSPSTRRRFPRFLPLALPAGLAAALLGASVALACHASQITGACGSNGTKISGVVTSSDPVSTTITLDLQYEVGSTWTTFGTTTATFGTPGGDDNEGGSSGTTASYSTPFTAHSGATGYRVIYDGKNSVVANQSPPAFFSFAGCSGPTAAAFSRLSVHVVGTQHVLRWYSAQHVLGYNVFAGQTRLNSRLVISTGHWYAFATNHATAGLRVVAVLVGGASH